jgi:putative leucine-rich repeat-containing protein DDB_G0292252
MNRRFLSLSLVVALVLGASSCGKKSSNEPIKPNPTTPVPSNNGGSTAGGSNNGSNGNTTTGENNSGNNNNGGSTNAGNTNSGNAQESNADITLTVPAGKSITINRTTYTANPQNKIFLKGRSFTKLAISGDDLPSLDISGNNLTEVQIKEEMAKLTKLRIVSKERHVNQTLALDLSGLTNVTSLTLAGYNFGTVDLSKMSNLKELFLGLRAPEKDTNFAKVIWPTNNNIQKILARSPLTEQIVDLNNLPNLVEARLISPYFGKISFDRSTKLQLVLVSNPTGSKNFDLELKNHPDLRDVSLNGVTAKKLVITNAPNLSSQESNLRGVTVDELELTGVNRDGVVKVLQSIDKNGLKKAVLPNYGFTLGTAPLDGFSHLNTSNVTLK